MEAAATADTDSAAPAAAPSADIAPAAIGEDATAASAAMMGLPMPMPMPMPASMPMAYPTTGDAGAPRLHPIIFNPYAFRPARKQQEHAPGAPLQQAEHQGDYNIWYNRYCGGDRWDKAGKRSEAVNPGRRCNIENDAGFTRGDSETGAFCCLFFARGGCEKGPDCPFLHRAPNEYDEGRIGIAVDIFGRDRHATDREDMGGTGNFNTNNRTLYVAGFKTFPGDDPNEILRRHFGEWGEIEKLVVIPGRAMAFVTYKLRVCAEFAKEAMANQSLDHDEVINVRWAHQKVEKPREPRDEKELAAKRRAAVAASVGPGTGHGVAAAATAAAAAAAAAAGGPMAKRPHTATDPSAYPDTDAQYGADALPEFSQFYTWDAEQGRYVFASPWAYYMYMAGRIPADLMPPAPPPAAPELPPELEDEQDREAALQEVLRQQAAAMGFAGGDDATAAGSEANRKRKQA